MKDLIEEIYDNDNSLAHSFISQTREVRNAYLNEERLIKELEPLLGDEAAQIFEKLRNVQIKINAASHRQAFVAGVRTGARLLIEAMGDD